MRGRRTEQSRADPARAARARARARRSSCSRCCARGGSRWGRCWSASSDQFADWLGVDDAVAVSRDGGAASRGTGARAGGAATRWSPSPFSFVASANCLLYEGVDARVLRRRSGDAEPRPGGRRRGASASAPSGLLPVDLFGYPAAMPELERDRGTIAAWRCSRTRARRSAPSIPRASASGRAATWRPSPSTPTSS